MDTGDAPDTGEPDDTSNLDQSIPQGADATRGNELYNQHCANCHVDGYAPDMQTVVPNIGNASIENAIQNGIGGMPAIQAASAPQDIKDIIAYLRTTYPSQGQGSGDPGGGNPDDSGNEQVDGEELANIHCNSCHINGYAPNFAYLIPYMPVDELEAVIINGTSGGMPSFSFTEPELNALIYYLAQEYGN